MTYQMMQAVSLATSELPTDPAVSIGTDEEEWQVHERANGREGKLDDDAASDLSEFGIDFI
jgi:hypothetical protein